MSAVEFVLGELFQDEWAKATISNANDTLYWRELQKKAASEAAFMVPRPDEESGLLSVGGIKEGEAKKRHVSPKIQKTEIVTN